MTTASRTCVLCGDITRLKVDAIVNAANTSLLGGGGVDGAIHRAAGRGLLDECRRVGGCPTGEARLTRGYDLPAEFVIHAVGPVFRGATSDAVLLRSAYESALRLAEDAGIESMAFPCVSTGVYGYPKVEACDIAVGTVLDWLDSHELPRRVVFCCFDAENEAVYRARLGPPA